MVQLIADDDILFAGTVNPSDVPAAMMLINEVVQQYAEVYAREVSALASPSDETDEVASGVGVNEVLYGLMSEGDKLEELTTDPDPDPDLYAMTIAEALDAMRNKG